MFIYKIKSLILLPVIIVATAFVSHAQDSSAYARRLATVKDINIAYHPVIDSYISSFTANPNATAEAIGRYQYYKPFIDSVLDANLLPRTVGLMMLGSTMANCAYNDDDGFSGPWAMSYNAARLWGLKMNTYVDERRDFEKSTLASVKYIKELYLLYNVPSLAMAAFATTTTTVNKCIRQAGNKFDYWTIYDSLPQPAKKIVPAYLAAVYIYNFYPEHGISPKPYKFAQYDTISVTKWQSFDDMAVALHTTPQLLRELNPEFKQGIVPMSRVPYTIKLPAHSKAHYKKLDSLTFKPYNTNPYIEKVPELENKNLPIRKLDDTASANILITRPDSIPKITIVAAKGESDTIVHIVQRGEGLGIIAQKYKVKVEDIKKWNKIKGYSVYPKQKLYIYRKPMD